MEGFRISVIHISTAGYAQLRMSICEGRSNIILKKSSD